MGNKIKYGLKNAHYAVLTEGETDTYGTPVAWPGAVNLTLSAVGDRTPFIADDSEYYTSVGNNGYDGTMECAELPESFATDVLKEEADGNKVLFEKNTVEPVPVALLFEFTGDQHQIKHCLYKCIFTRPNIEGAATVNKDVKTNTLNIQARPNRAGIVKAKTKSDTLTAADSGWYTAVPVFTAPTGG